MKKFFFIFLILLLSCDAGTVKVNLASIMKMQDIQIPLATDSVQVNLVDTLFIVSKGSRVRIVADESKRVFLLKFVRDSGVPLLSGDTVFIRGICEVKIPAYIPVIIFADSADVYSFRADIRRGRFIHSKVVLDTECDEGPFYFVQSYLEIKIPGGCNITVSPDNGASLRANIRFPAFLIYRYAIDSAEVFLRRN